MDRTCKWRLSINNLELILKPTCPCKACSSPYVLDFEVVLQCIMRIEVLEKHDFQIEISEKYVDRIMFWSVPT